MKNKKFILPIGILLFIIFTCSLIHVHIRIQTTLVGYEIGRFKSKESSLLKKRSMLLVELSRVSKKDKLKELISKTKGRYLARR